MTPRSTLKVLLIAALSALAVLALPAIAAAKDRNHDRIPDRWEKRHHLSLKVKQTGRDQDSDRLHNRAEFLSGDDPRDEDSDDDGVMDGEENAGTIASFDTTSGKLTIDLFGGDSISGLVDEGTRIKCEDEHSPDVAAASHDGGDDHGDHEDEVGDDRGGDDAVDDDRGDEGHSGPSSPNSGPGGHDDDGTGANCTTSDLVPGAVVEEAELELHDGVATFDEVEVAD